MITRALANKMVRQYGLHHDNKYIVKPVLITSITKPVNNIEISMM